MDLIVILGLIATFVLSVSAIAYLELRPRRVVLELRWAHFAAMRGWWTSAYGLGRAAAPLSARRELVSRLFAFLR